MQVPLSSVLNATATYKIAGVFEKIIQSYNETKFESVAEEVEALRGIIQNTYETCLEISKEELETIGVTELNVDLSQMVTVFPTEEIEIEEN